MAKRNAGLVAAVIAAVTAAGSAAEAQKTEPAPSPWQHAKIEGAARHVAWVHALGTLAQPDFCGAYAALKSGAEFRQSAFQRRVQNQRLACLMIHCAPAADGKPRQVTADFILFGRAALGDKPGAAASRSLAVTLRADAMPLAVTTESEFRVEPIPFDESRTEARHYVRIGFGPLERGALETLMRATSLAVPAIKGRYATMAGTADLAIGAYRFDMRGAAAALATLEAACK